MIKLQRTNEPPELIENAEALIAEYLDKGTDVWQKGYIKKALLGMSNDKCCYCECKVTEESKYLEVEHFKYKDKYPGEVVTWTNLLPSCKKCNGTKGKHDVVITPIIDPSVQDPKDHLKMNLYRLKPMSSLGDETIVALNLNDFERLVQKRFLIGERVQSDFDKLFDLLLKYKTQPTKRTQNILINGIKGLLKEGLPVAEFSATVSTVIFNLPEYQKFKSELINLTLWDQELIDLEINSLKTKLTI